MSRRVTGLLKALKTCLGVPGYGPCSVKTNCVFFHIFGGFPGSGSVTCRAQCLFGRAMDTMKGKKGDAKGKLSTIKGKMFMKGKALAALKGKGKVPQNWEGKGKGGLAATSPTPGPSPPTATSSPADMPKADEPKPTPSETGTDASQTTPSGTPGLPRKLSFSEAKDRHGFVASLIFTVTNIIYVPKIF